MDQLKVGAGRKGDERVTYEIKDLINDRKGPNGMEYLVGERTRHLVSRGRVKKRLMVGRSSRTIGGTKLPEVLTSDWCCEAAVG